MSNNKKFSKFRYILSDVVKLTFRGKNMHPCHYFYVYNVIDRYQDLSLNSKVQLIPKGSKYDISMELGSRNYNESER